MSKILTSHSIQIATFHLDDMWLGIDIDVVQEVKKLAETTPVPTARESIDGVIHLRGEIVTILDLRTLMGIPQAEVDSERVMIVVDLDDERVGLLVDRVDDVHSLDGELLEPVPPNLNFAGCEHFRNVVNMDDRLLCVLDVRDLLA